MSILTSGRNIKRHYFLCLKVEQLSSLPIKVISIFPSTPTFVLRFIMVGQLGQVSSDRLKEFSILLCDGPIESEDPCLMSVCVVGMINEYDDCSVIFFIIFIVNDLYFKKGDPHFRRTDIFLSFTPFSLQKSATKDTSHRRRNNGKWKNDSSKHK